MGALRAVKVIHRRQEGDRPYEREFEGIQRYEPVSRSSGGLVHVLQVGRNELEGYFYYVMELADSAEEIPQPSGSPVDLLGSPRSGRPHDPAFQPSDFRYSPRTLRSDLKRMGRLPTADCLRLALDVVSGLAQLHRHRLVHRDVKPGNIIYANGRAKLADIGLVSAGGEARTFVGTEGYIPPEGPGTPAADLFALGVVLYEASTGYPPERFPDAPPEWFADSAGQEALEFHEVILKACEGQRERRYRGADEMQADLALLQSGQSVRQFRALKRRYARLKFFGIVGTTLLAAALGIGLFASYLARLEAENRAKEMRLREQAQQSLTRAEHAERAARYQLSSALYEQARALVLSKELGHRERALDAIRRSVGATNVTELRRVAFAALGLADLRLIREFPLLPEQTLAQVDPKFERIALGRGSDPITICSVSNRAVLAVLPASSSNPAHFARWSSDGRFLAVKRHTQSWGARADVEVWEVGPRPHLVSIFHDVSYNAFNFHPQRPLLIVAPAEKAASVWDLDTGRQSCAFDIAPEIASLAYSADGKRFAAGCLRAGKFVIRIHEATTGTLLREVGCPDLMEQIAWDPYGRWISSIGVAAIESNRAVPLIAPDSGALTVLGRHKFKTAMVQFTPDGGYLMSAGWERELICWNLRTQERVFTFAGTGFNQTWRDDGAQCALIFPALPEEKLQFYVFDRPACRELARHGEEGLSAGAFSPDGRWLAVPSSRELCVWDLAGGLEPARLRIPSHSEVFFSPDSSELYALSGPIEEAQLQAWHLIRSGDVSGPPHLAPVTVEVPPHLSGAALVGNDLVLTSAEGVRIRSKANGDRVVKIPYGKAIVSPDGRWLAVTYSFSEHITIFRLPAVERVAELVTDGAVAQVVFSPRSDELTVVNRSGLEWWDTTTWERNRHQPGRPAADPYLFYTPDGAGLWKVTSYRDSGLWDRRTLEPLLPLPRNEVPLTVSADGRWLAVSVDDQRVQVWDMAELRAKFREVGLDWTDSR